MPSNIVSLDTELRLCRGNAIRSSYYAQKAALLTDERRRNRLLIMEAKLFGEQRSLNTCKIGPLPQPEAHFRCYEGTIWYYFSRNQSKYVLLEFDFNSGGGSGGVPLPEDDQPISPSSTKSFLDELRDRLVARGEALCRAVLPRTGHFFPRFVTRNFPVVSASLRGQSHDRSASYPAAATTISGASLQEIQRDLLVLQAALLPHQSRRPVYLPHWSVLGRFVATPEQLENPYARSILAGEALCHLTETCVDARAPAMSGIVGREDIWEKFSHPENTDADLLAESKWIINTLFGDRRFVAANRPYSKFATTCLLDHECIADDRILNLVRGELILRLSSSISRKSFMICMRRESDKRNSADPREYSDIIKMYSLLGKFAMLSEELFGSHNEDIDIGGVIEDFDAKWCASNGDMKLYFNLIYRFNQSTSLVLGGSEFFSDYGNADDVREELISVTSELLGSRGKNYVH